ncbi:MAG TPA: uroporphyrinogen decarboxylase [Longimicrobiales bacterium]|nr:uroporphyrinogen decarboxylase [Longimicrobiales bacterium]
MPDGATLFERACRGERGERVPIWIMRQAGRYLPEYRKLRESVDFLTSTKTPELAARITLQPMERFPLDAAILFSDIMTPLEGMGVALDFDPGPVLPEPVRSAAAARALRPLDPEEATPFVLETLRMVRSELEPDRALIGFAGAPFTLFCYLVQGGGSKDFMEARSFLRLESEAATGLLDLLGDSMARYLVAQARAGADALMLFDSWVGLLGPSSYQRFVLPLMQRVVAQIRAETDRPIIYFPNGGATLLPLVQEVGADVVGIDWTVPLSRATSELGRELVVQGNLDPAALFAPREELDAAVREVLREGASAPAHIFNLGHGIHRTTDPDQVAFLVDRVHERSSRTD